MSYFESLLKKKEFEQCPLPLWKLRLTDDEYEELRKFLREGTEPRNTYMRPFFNLKKEAALFFSEYWRREYLEGAHSIDEVYSALDPVNNSKDYQGAFYDAACEGADSLGIERYEGARNTPLYDMLYQGGLPMRCLIERNGQYAVWDRFARGLVNRRIDFKELNLGAVARQSQSLQEFCRWLMRGVESEDFNQMPFYCADENNIWYQYLCKLAREERTRRVESKPFSLKWEFEIDMIDNKVKNVYFVVEGPRELPAAFLEQRELTNQTFLSAQVRVNGKTGDVFNFINNHNHYPVISKRAYHQGDSIALFLQAGDNEMPLLDGVLNMAEPQILFCNKEGNYEIGNKMGTDEGLILYPKDWTVENADRYKIEYFSWGDTVLSGIRLAADTTESISLSSEVDGRRTFGGNTESCRIEIRNAPIAMPFVEEAIYDAGNCSYLLRYDNERCERAINRNNVEYRSKWQKEWSDTPAYGEIFVRVKSEKCAETRPLINVGDGLSITILEATADTCRVNVNWTHGTVHTTEGRKENDAWIIKQDHQNPIKKIHFVFTPLGNPNNQFKLTVKAPFRDFLICDEYGKPIQNECWIPCAGLDRYQYHIAGQDIRKFSFGNTEKRLFWYGNQLYLSDDGVRTPIPYEGSLSILFGADPYNTPRSLLDKTSKSLIDADVEVSFELDDGNIKRFYIKDSPYRVSQDGGKINIVDNNSMLSNFHETLKLIRMDEPDKEPVDLVFHEEEGYVLPEEIRQWGLTFLCGERARAGFICPTVVDLNKTMDSDDRQRNRVNAKDAIMAELSQSHMDDDVWKRITGWFRRVNEFGIPASSLLVLDCAAQSPQHLLYLAFILYIDQKNDKYKLKEQLENLSAELAFQWYWASPYLNGFARSLQEFIGSLDSSPIVKNVFISWALQQNNPNEYLVSLKTDQYCENAGRCLSELLNSFDIWMRELFVSSMLESYDYTGEALRPEAEGIINDGNLIRMNNDGAAYIENGQDYLGEASTAFFNDYADQNANLTANESWLMKRVNVVAAQLTGNLDLFSQPNEIRRSVIYCIKSNVNRFIAELNNKLINR